jgi:hypothetical protein
MGLRHAAKDITSQARSLNATGAERRRLWAEGVTASAVITTASDTGERLAGNVVLELGLRVTVVGRAPYAVTLRVPIAGSDTSPYDPGRRYAVKIDRHDPHKLTFSA